jgi:hypothetical protein
MSFGRNTAAVMPEGREGRIGAGAAGPIARREDPQLDQISDRRLSPGEPGGGGASHRPMVARAGYATRDLPLLKSSR